METSAVQHAKMVVVAAVGLQKDALHVYAGLTIFLVALSVLRSRPRSVIPLVAVALVAVLGEIVDARDDVNSLGHWRWRASAHDLWNTLFWPSVLWVLLRIGALRLGGTNPGARDDA
jgi:uncharacterized membrane protein YqgA involved in biofilm formation